MSTAWEKLSSRVEREGYVTLRSDRYRLPDGNVKDFDVVSFDSNAASIVLPITRDGRIVTAVQFRWGSERVMHDLPAGSIGTGESPIEAAKRELREETGYASNEWTALGSAPILASSALVKHFFLAHGCTKVADQDLDASEFIEVELLDQAAFERVIEQGLCHDAEAWFCALAKDFV